MAHWIVDDRGFGGVYYTCSKCGSVWNDLFGNREKDNCRFCGAVMDEEADCGEYVEVKRKPRTNGDKIREMSNQEIAEFIDSEIYCLASNLCGEGMCAECLLKYLNEEVEE